MITGSWDDITLVYVNTYDEPVEMVLQEGSASLFYACQKYHRKNHSEDEYACKNRLSIDDFLKALEGMLQGLVFLILLPQCLPGPTSALHMRLHLMPHKASAVPRLHSP